MANWSSTSGLGGVPEIEVYVAGAENFTAGSIHRVPRYGVWHFVVSSYLVSPSLCMQLWPVQHGSRVAAFQVGKGCRYVCVCILWYTVMYGVHHSASSLGRFVIEGRSSWHSSH